LILSFPDTPDGDYYVLDTDYTTYSAVYSCGNIGPVKIEYAWLLAREQTVSPADMVLHNLHYILDTHFKINLPTILYKLQEIALSKFTQFGIDVSQFKPTLQGETCVYYPEYPTI
jgi:apolipoprotein D and lipocalin family protein